MAVLLLILDAVSDGPKQVNKPDQAEIKSLDKAVAEARLIFTDAHTHGAEEERFVNGPVV